MDHDFLTLMNWRGPLCTIQRLKAECDEALSDLGFNFSLRRYTKADAVASAAAAAAAAAAKDAKVLPCRLTQSNPR
jgi:hypothetical protein